MKNVAVTLDVPQPALQYGVVAGEQDGQWTVAVNDALYGASLAKSCLVRPEKNDIVFVCLDNLGCCYILSILESPDDERRPTRLSFDGKVDLEVRNGGLRVSANDGITFTTPEKLAMTSESLEMNALRGDVRIESFSFLGRLFNAHVEKMKVVADMVDSIFRQAVQRFMSSYRYIEEHEEIQSGSTRMLVEGTLTIQTKDTMHTAEGQVKIDAEQIHLG